jgi:DNA-binding HxlR family transcriptional regulator
MSLELRSRRITPELDRLNLVAENNRQLVNSVRSWVMEEYYVDAFQMAPTAHIIYAFILSRTVGRYQKFAEWIPEKQFLDGVTSSNGDVVTLGIKISPRSLSVHLNSLEELGWIHREAFFRHGRKTYAYLPLKLADLFEFFEIGGFEIPECYRNSTN